MHQLRNQSFKKGLKNSELDNLALLMLYKKAWNDSFCESIPNFQQKIGRT